MSDVMGMSESQQEDYLMWWSDKELWTAVARCKDEGWHDTKQIYLNELGRRGKLDLPSTP